MNFALLTCLSCALPDSHTCISCACRWVIGLSYRYNAYTRTQTYLVDNVTQWLLTEIVSIKIQAYIWTHTYLVDKIKALVKQLYIQRLPTHIIVSIKIQSYILALYPHWDNTGYDYRYGSLGRYQIIEFVERQFNQIFFYISSLFSF